MTIKRRNKTSAILAAALTGLACAPALATSSASASLGPLSITLVDLDLTDGITPSITFDTAIGNYVYAGAYDTSNGQSSNEQANGAAAWDPGAVATSGVANAWAKATIAGSGGAESTSWSASGAAHGAGAPGTYAVFNGTAVTPYYSGNGFSLSAHTQLIIYASAAVSASVTASWDPAFGGSEYATGYTVLNGYLNDGSGYGYDAIAVGTNGKYYDTSPPCPSMVYGYCYGPDSVSNSRTLSVSVANYSDSSMDGSLQAFVQAYGTSYAPAVPEPETWALMLAGLVGLRWVARRRDRT